MKATIFSTTKIAMRKISKAGMLLVILFMMSTVVFSQDDRGFNLASIDIRSMPITARLPFGGDTMNNQCLSAFGFGPAFDLFNLYDNDNRTRFSFLNITPYIIGFDYLKLNPYNKTQAFNLLYVTAGPHYRWAGLINRKNNPDFISLGVQVGAAMLLKGNPHSSCTDVQYNFHVSFTCSWTPYKDTRAQVVDGNNLTGFFLLGALSTLCFTMGQDRELINNSIAQKWIGVAGTAAGLGSIVCFSHSFPIKYQY
jgi:hypothetical protein